MATLVNRRTGAAVVCAWLSLCGSLLGCGQDADSQGEAAQLPCGSPPGDWRYVLSCDSTVGVVHQCIDYYATASAASAVGASFKAVCQVQAGMVLAGQCPSQGSIGSCVQTASNGPTASSPQAVLEQQYFYDVSETPDSYRRTCDEHRGLYVAAGDDSAKPTGSAGGGSCKTGSSDVGSQGGVAFSLSILANGETIGCTNYIGQVSQAQLDSVIAIGAETTPCPSANALCGCASKGDGTFGTDTQRVYYLTVGSNAGECPNDAASCKPYKAP
jgi:hypothetical protein